MIDEVTSAWVSRHEVREKLDEELDVIGEPFAAMLRGRSIRDVRAESWGDDPANEQGAQALMQIAAMGGSR